MKSDIINNYTIHYEVFQDGWRYDIIVDEGKPEGTLCNMKWGFETFKECQKAAVKEVLECWL